MQRRLGPCVRAKCGLVGVASRSPRPAPRGLSQVMRTIARNRRNIARRRSRVRALCTRCERLSCAGGDATCAGSAPEFPQIIGWRRATPRRARRDTRRPLACCSCAGMHPWRQGSRVVKCSGVEAPHRRLGIHKRGILVQCHRPAPPIGRLGLLLISGIMLTRLLWDAQSCILCRRAAAFAVFQPPSPWPW
jgi:hypothetical protein